MPRVKRVHFRDAAFWIVKTSVLAVQRPLATFFQVSGPVSRVLIGLCEVLAQRIGNDAVALSPRAEVVASEYRGCTLV